MLSLSQVCHATAPMVNCDTMFSAIEAEMSNAYAEEGQEYNRFLAGMQLSKSKF